MSLTGMYLRVLLASTFLQMSVVATLTAVVQLRENVFILVLLSSATAELAGLENTAIKVRFTRP